MSRTQQAMGCFHDAMHPVQTGSQSRPHLPFQIFIVIAWLLGMCSVLWQSWWVVLLLSGVLLWCRLTHQSWQKFLILMGVSVLGHAHLGHSWWRWTHAVQQVHQLTHVTGHVEAVMHKSHQTHIMLKVDTAVPTSCMGQRLRLLGNLHAIETKDVDRLAATVRCRAYHGRANGLMLDGLWSGWQRHQIGSCHVLQWRRLPGSDVASMVHHVRQYFLKRLVAHTSLQYEAMLRALVLGDQSGLDASTWSALRWTGTAHLVAVSGLHIGLMALLWARGFGFIWAQGVRWWWRVHRQCFERIGAFMGAWVYMLLSGGGVSSMRAFWMVCCVVVVHMCRWRTPPEVILAIVILWLLLWQPAMMVAAGFWLSVLAVALLLVSDAQRMCRQHVFCCILSHTAWRLYFGMLPLMAVLVLPLGTLALWVNAWAIPLFSTLVVPCGVLATLLSPWSTWADACLQGLDVFFQFFFHLLTWMQRMVGYAVFVPVGNAFQLMCLVMSCVAWLLCRCVRTLGWMLLVCAMGYVAATPRVMKGYLWWTVLDVGQGLSVVLKTAHHVLLYDAGPRGQGVQVVLPWLRQQGVAQLDGVVISHRDQDHMGGLAAIAGAIPIDHLWAPSGRPLLQHKHHMSCGIPKVWIWDGVRFVFLNDPEMHATHKNTRSCVLKVVGLGGTLLLPGDLDHAGEAMLLRHWPKRLLRANVLVLGHHGSRTASSPAFIDAVAPTHAIVSAGYFERFHHPDPGVMARLHRLGIRVWHTFHLGAIGNTNSVPWQIRGRRLLQPEHVTKKTCLHRWWHWLGNTALAGGMAWVISMAWRVVGF